MAERIAFQSGRALKNFRKRTLRMFEREASQGGEYFEFAHDAHPMLKILPVLASPRFNGKSDLRRPERRVHRNGPMLEFRRYSNISFKPMSVRRRCEADLPAV